MLENFYVWQLSQFLGSQGFSNYIGRTVSFGETNDNVLDMLIDAIRKGESPMSVIPSPGLESVIINIPDLTDGVLGNLSNLSHK